MSGILYNSVSNSSLLMLYAQLNYYARVNTSHTSNASHRNQFFEQLDFYLWLSYGCFSSLLSILLVEMFSLTIQNFK